MQTETTLKTQEDARIWLTAHAPNERISGDVVIVESCCARCNGTGIVRPWGACFTCGGSGNRSTRHVPLLVRARQLRANERAADRRAAKRTAAATARELARTSKANAWREAHPDVAAILAEPTHPILRDLAAKLEQWGSLTPGQEGLARKIAHEQANRRPNVPAPTGRVDFTGTVIKTAVQDGFSPFRGVRGPSVTKITVKVSTDAGDWLVWLTAPADLLREAADRSLNGATVTLSASLERGREAHFAIGKRPTLIKATWPEGTAE